MRSIVSLLPLVLLFGASGAELSPRRISFDDQAAGELPAAFTCGLTGSGRPGTWTLLADATAPSRPNVLAQLDEDPTSHRFPFCVLDGTTGSDVDLSVRFKPVKGAKDQAAGMLFRYRDENNYYVVRANALEGNVVLYKVENGTRSDLKPRGAGQQAYGKKANVASGAWGLLRVVALGNVFTVHLGSERLFEVEDATFRGAGKVGIWTKADSVTYFDDLSVTFRRAALPAGRPAVTIPGHAAKRSRAIHLELPDRGRVPPAGGDPVAQRLEAPGRRANGARCRRRRGAG
jgi:hypothetical protein